MAAGRVTVPTNSRIITNCIDIQKTPHSSRTRTSSMRLWIVELIHLLRWDKRTLNSAGTVVLQYARGTKMSFRRGKVRNIKVVKNRSSPSSNRFFLCRDSTTRSEYVLMTSGLVKIGTQYPSPLGALMRYMQKQPGRQVTLPKMDSKAFARC